MSDFSRQLADELGIDHETALRAHLTSRCWPPIQGSHQDLIVAGFQAYWAGDLTLDQLMERIGWVSGAGRFVQVFAGFVNFARLSKEG